MSDFEVGARVEVRPEFRGAGLRNPRGTVTANPAVRRRSSLSDEVRVYEGFVDVRTDAGEQLWGLSFDQIEHERLDADR